jgi:hypothetical protein
MRSAWVWAIAGMSVVAPACSSQVLPPSVQEDAGAVEAGRSPPDLAAPPEDAMAITDTGEAGAPPSPALYPSTGAPPLAGDGKLADVPDEVPGGSPDGWDLCGQGLSKAPREGKGDPPAVRGQNYLLYRSEDARRAPAVPERVAQAYFYFGAPVSLADKGLWMELSLVSGQAAPATFSLYAVDKVCSRSALVATYALTPVLQTPGRWTTTCFPLPAGLRVDGLGFRLDATDAEIGVDAFRFGPPCPRLP